LKAQMAIGDMKLLNLIDQFDRLGPDRTIDLYILSLRREMSNNSIRINKLKAEFLRNEAFKILRRVPPPSMAEFKNRADREILREQRAMERLKIDGMTWKRAKFDLSTTAQLVQAGLDQEKFQIIEDGGYVLSGPVSVDDIEIIKDTLPIDKVASYYAQFIYEKHSLGIDEADAAGLFGKVLDLDRDVAEYFVNNGDLFPGIYAEIIARYNGDSDLLSEEVTMQSELVSSLELGGNKEQLIDLR